MKKYHTLEILIYLGIILVLLVAFVSINNYIKQKRITGVVPIDDSPNYAYNIEKAEIINGYIEITGWFFELKSVRNVPIENDDSNKQLGICLYDLKNDELIKESEKKNMKYNADGINAEVTKITRSDINEYYKCDYDYSECGFVAKISLDELDMDCNYQILIKPDSKEKEALRTNGFFDKSGFSYVNQDKYMMPDLEGTFLDTVIKDGKCLACRLDYGIYVFQYDWKLYWIASDDFAFDDLGQTYIQYQLETTQFDRLPAERVGEGWFWDNNSFCFEDNEVTKELKCKRYRVSVVDLPVDYAVTDILTGVYGDADWIWKQWFRPVISGRK